jgi:hypothetical protein
VRRPAVPDLAVLPVLARPLTRPISGLAGLAVFIRQRLALVGDSLRGRGESTPSRDVEAATVIVAAAAPFAPTSFARARLLRQLHASGLLTDHEAEQAEQLLGVAQSG